METTTVLIVEDEFVISLDLQEQLRQLGYHVVATAVSGERAIQLAGELQPDIVLMDIKLAGAIDGIEAGDAIHQRYGIPVIYLTAFASQDIVDRAKHTEPVGYLIKPFDRDQFRTTIEVALFKHELNQRLIASETRYRMISELTSDFAYAMHLADDGTAQLEWITDAVARITGYQPEEIIAQGGWKSLVDPADQPLMAEHLQRLRAGQPSQQELRIVDRLGKARWLLDYARPVWDERQGRVVRIYGAAQDITRRKQAQEAERAARRQLRDLAGYLQAAREEERTKIAREVHDELGQALTAIKMDVAWLARRIDEQQVSLRAKTNNMLELVDQTIQAVRRVATELRPGLLDDLGLVAALEWQVQEFSERTGIRYHMEPEMDEITLDGQRATAIFRIFQETLTNIVRHAGASQVWVDLQDGPTEVVLTVRDDGNGISIDQATRPTSLGLLGMRERARTWGGEVTVQGFAGQGTTVTVRLPRPVSEDVQVES